MAEAYVDLIAGVVPRMGATQGCGIRCFAWICATQLFLRACNLLNMQSKGWELLQFATFKIMCGHCANFPIHGWQIELKSQPGMSVKKR